MKTKKLLLSTAVTLSTLCAFSSQVIAQGRVASSALEEVIVTAGKDGGKNLQDAAQTIQVYSSDVIDKLGLDDFEDYASFTPGVDFQKSAPARTQIIIRGITLGRVSSSEPQNRAAVGLYLNDVPITQNGLNVDPDLFDMSNIEILKGPQGSLFGDSAMAGAVRYNTRQPNSQEFGGRFLANVSTTKGGDTSYNVKGALNVPIIEDELALRVVAYHRDIGGYIDNDLLDKKDVNTEETDGIRFSFSWDVNDVLTADLDLWMQDMLVGDDPREEEGNGKPGQRSLAFESRYAASFDDEFKFASLFLNWGFDWGDVSSLTGYTDRSFVNVGRKTTEEIFGGALGNPDPVIKGIWETDKFTQEFRVSVLNGDFFEGTFGVFYSDGTTDYQTDAFGGGFDQFAIDVFGLPNIDAVNALGCGADLPDYFFCGAQINDETQKAVFGELYVNFTDNLKLTLGGRWYDYEQEFNENYGGFFNGIPTSGREVLTDDGFLPKVGLEYHASEDVLFYATGAEGYRLGGVNDPLPFFCDADLNALGLDGSGTYDPDTVTSYEAGSKTSWLNNRLNFNGSIFYSKWEDVQTAVLLPTCAFVLTQNASEQEVYGAEIESDLLIGEDIALHMGLAYTDSTLSAAAPVVGGDKGDRAPYVPKWKASISADYNFIINEEVSGVATLLVSHQTKAYSTYDQSLEIPERTVANFRLAFNVEDYTFTAFANNVTDERIVNDAEARGRPGEVHYAIGQPRNVGVEFSMDF